MKRKWTEEQLINACKNNTTKASVLRELGLSTKSGNYQTIDLCIKNLNINILHFKQETSKNFNNEISLEQILIKDSKYISTSNLKRKLLKKRKTFTKFSFIIRKIEKNRCNFSTFLKKIRKPNVISVVHCT